MTSTPRSLGISVAFVSLRCTRAHEDAWSRMELRLLADPAWSAWLATHEGHRVGHYLALDDVARETSRFRRRTAEVQQVVPFDRVLAAEERGRTEAELGEVARAIFVRWAAKVGAPAPPPLP